MSRGQLQLHVALDRGLSAGGEARSGLLLHLPWLGNDLWLEESQWVRFSTQLQMYAVRDHWFQEDLVGSLTGNGRTLEQAMAPRLASTARRGTYYWSSLDVTYKS